VILQLNTRYYRDCYTENADKTQLDGLWLADLQGKEGFLHW